MHNTDYNLVEGTHNKMDVESGSSANNKRSPALVISITAAVFSAFLLLICLLVLIGAITKNSSSTSTKDGTTSTVLPQWDLLLVGGTVYDGTGLPAFKADVAIKDGKIVQVGTTLDASMATEVVNVTNLAVAPGFIDAHTHSDIRLAYDITGDSRLRDGITTELAGLCGQSLAPCVDSGCIKWRSEELWAPVPTSVLNQIGSFKSEVDWFNKQKPSTNLMLWAGHNTIRSATCGSAATCTDSQLQKSKDLLRQAMLEGAWGLSTGLSYTPGVFSPLSELVELNKVVQELDGYHLCHMRDEGKSVLESIAETMEVAKQSKVKTTISHLKIMSKQMSNKTTALFGMLDNAVSSGLNVWADVYPYSAIGSDLHYGMPKWLSTIPVDQRIAALNNNTIRAQLKAFVDSGVMFSNLGISGWSDVWPSNTGNPDWDGKSITVIANRLGMTEFDAWIHLMIDCRFRCMAVYFNMDDAVVEAIIKHPRVMMGSDGSSIRLGGDLSPGHPRWLGSASRLIGHYARDLKVISMETAVHKLTGMITGRYGLTTRGRVAPGMIADITVFDPAAIIDKSTFVSSKQYSAGIVHVMLRGIFAIRDTKLTGIRSGQVIPGPAFKP